MFVRLYIVLPVTVLCIEGAPPRAIAHTERAVADVLLSALLARSCIILSAIMWLPADCEKIPVVLPDVVATVLVDLLVRLAMVLPVTVRFPFPVLLIPITICVPFVDSGVA